MGVLPVVVNYYIILIVDYTCNHLKELVYIEIVRLTFEVIVKVHTLDGRMPTKCETDKCFYSIAALGKVYCNCYTKGLKIMEVST